MSDTNNIKSSPKDKQESSKKTAAAEKSGEKPKPCCACPETRRNRDECIMENGEANCQNFIQAHRECMAKYGYII